MYSTTCICTHTHFTTKYICIPIMFVYLDMYAFFVPCSYQHTECIHTNKLDKHMRMYRL